MLLLPIFDYDFLSGCPSLMHDIDILYVQHCQVMWELGVCKVNDVQLLVCTKYASSYEIVFIPPKIPLPPPWMEKLNCMDPLLYRSCYGIFVCLGFVKQGILFILVILMFFIIVSYSRLEF